MLDSDEFKGALAIMDPENYPDRLAKLPKLAVISSNDEFMQVG